MRQAWSGLSVLLACALAPSAKAGSTEPARLPLLTRIGQIRSLPRSEAARGYPLKVRAAVTFFDKDYQTLFVEDDSGAIYVDAPLPVDNPLASGDLVEIEGTTPPPDFSTDIKPTHIRRLGRGSLPHPLRLSYEQLEQADKDCLWVEVEGVVRSLERMGVAQDAHHQFWEKNLDVPSVGDSRPSTYLRLRLAMGSARFPVYIRHSGPVDPAKFLDAHVRLRGVRASFLNSRNQPIGINMFVPGLEYVQLLEPPPATPSVGLIDLLQGSAERLSGHRVKIKGEVTLQAPGQVVYLQEGQDGIRVESRQTGTLPVGEEVEATGFPAMGSFEAILEDATLQRLGPGAQLLPLSITPQGALTASHDGGLVSVEGRLISSNLGLRHHSLMLQSESTSFLARLDAEVADDAFLRGLEVGSQLRVQGICTVAADADGWPTSFQILLRSPADVAVIGAPLWWTARHAAGFLIVLGAGILLFVIWVRLLKARVDQRTETIRATLESTGDGIMVVSPSMEIEAYNRRFADMWQIPESLLKTRNRHAVLESIRGFLKDPEGFFAGVAHLYQDPLGKSDDVIELKDGRVFERHTEPQLVDGQNVGRVLAFRDITESRRLEAELRDSGDYVKAVISTMQAGLLVLDAETHQITDVNSCALTMMGRSREEVIGQLCHGFVCPAELGRCPMTDLHQQIDHSERKLLRSDGSSTPILESVLPLVRQGRTYLVEVFADMTELERAHAELLEAKEAAEAANRAKSEFLANMSHEIRTPLNGIMGMTDLALDGPMTTEQREYLEIVKTSADSLLGIVNDILDLSKIEAGKFELDVGVCDLRRLLGEVVAEFSIRAAAKDLNLASEIAVPPFVEADGSRLRQILVNLLGNALKFTERGGIHLTVHEESAETATSLLHFAVRDTGIGIPRDQQQRIFDAFAQGDGSTTRKFGGTGLGLTISSRLVTMMGGRLWMESQPRQGSTFHFTVALKKAQKPAVATPSLEPIPESEAEAAQLLRVLVVEDNKVNQTLAVRLLERHGHQVTVAENGRQAVEAVERGEFDLVFMDVQMPEMDGYEATGEIRKREQSSQRRVPIVAMTAHALKGDAERCLAAGMDAYLSKPIRPGELRTVLQRFASDGHVGGVR